MQKQNIIVAVVIGLVIAGAAFFGGMKYAESKGGMMLRGGVAGNIRGQFAAAGMRGGIRGGMGGGFVAGQIIAKDDKSITVKLQDGGSKIVFLTPATPVMKSVTGTGDDLVQGQFVTVTGPANQDGSVTAQSVQIRPAGQATSTMMRMNSGN